MRQEAAKKINTLEKKIKDLRDKQEEIRYKELEYEEAEEKRKWMKDNAECIQFCKALVGKAFTFGDSVIKHHTDKKNSVAIREYDYISIYFAKIVSYREKSQVCMGVRHMYSGDTYATLNDNTELFISLEKRGKDWIADELGGSFLGKLHVLTDEEFQEAFAFWEKRMSELGRTAFRKYYNIPELHWEQQCKDVPQDDPRAFGYHMGCFRARFELNPDTRWFDLVLTFEEMTFEGFLHPDDKVRIDMTKDAFAKFRVTYDPKTEKLKLDRLEEMAN